MIYYVIIKEYLEKGVERMIERFKTCLCYPRLIGQYVIDRKRTIFLYMVLLSLLCLVPTFIHIVRYSPTNNQAISNIKSEIMEKADDLEGGYILNGQLNVTKPATLTVGSVRVIINDNIDQDDLLYSFVATFKDNKVNIYYNMVVGYSFTYQELGLDNLNFNSLIDSTSENYMTSILKLKGAIDIIYDEVRDNYIMVEIIDTYLMLVLEYFLISLLLAVVFRMWRNISFKIILKICIYSLTITNVVILIGELFYFDWLFYVGVFLGAFYASTALRSINIIKIEGKE